jgi:6,7-dimethyl-8-ribityllumazine synthase
VGKIAGTDLTTWAKARAILPTRTGTLRAFAHPTGVSENQMAGPRRAASTDEGALDGARMLVVEARYYEGIADELLAGAKRALEAARAAYDVVTVPGALEIPQAIVIALDAAAKRRAPYDGVVALGCVIRGETIHFEIVSMESSRGLMDLSIAKKLPLGNGIITVNTEEQAWARARADDQNKGGDAARATLIMMRIKRRLEPRLDQLIKDRQRNAKG